MENIVPVSDLHAYNQILSEVKPGNEVILTKHGHAKYVVSDYEEYQRMKATVELFGEIHKGIQSIKNEEQMTVEQLKNRNKPNRQD